MIKKDDQLKAELLRQKAEMLLKKKTPETVSPFSEIEMLRLIHELEVHQVELQLQNDELRHAWAIAEVAQNKYTNLYEFAPSGYLTLSILSEIIDINITGAQMLCKDRSKLINHRFIDFVSQDTIEVFCLFLEKIFQTKIKESSEVKLLTQGENPTNVLLTGIITENQMHCNITMVDITTAKQLEERLLFVNKAVESAGDAIGISDAQGRHIYHNKALSDLFEYTTAEELQSAGGGFNAVKDPEVAKQLFDNIMQGKPWSGELEMVTKSGHIFPAYERADAITNNEGKIVGLIGVITDITERKQVEEKLRTISEFNQSLLQTIPFGMDIVDEYGNILFLSDRLKQHFGEDSLGKKCWNLYKDDKKQCSECPLHYGVNVGETKTYEATGVLGGKTFEIYHTGIIFNGQKAMLEAFIDITERKQVQQALIRSEKELKNAQQLTHIGSWYLDLATNQVEWSEELYKMYGFDPKLPPPSYTEHQSLFTPESWKILSSSIVNTKETGLPYNIEVKTRRKDGSNGWMWVRGETVLNKEGKVVGLWGAAQEITDRKLLEEELEKTNVRLMDAQIVAKIGSWETDLSNMEVKWSAETFRIFGLEPGSFHITHPNFLEFVHPEDRANIDRIFLESINTHSINTVQHRILTPREETKFVEENWRIFFDDYGKPTRALGTCADITERKLAEMELVKAKEHAEESDHLKSAFLANMSHEIRTPMNGILGFASLLKEPNLTGEDQQKYIRIIEKSGTRMLNIINDIVDISKIEAGLMEVNLKESNINDQMEYIFTFFKPEVEKKGMRFSFKNSLSGMEAIIETDREKIYAILTNLVKNSIKYTHEGSIDFGYEIKGEYLEFFVKDTGIGIARNRQEAIFERFIQADVEDTKAQQGAGLGLAITKAYVEMLGGKIWVISDEGSGSTFYFTIPYKVEKHLKSLHSNVGSATDIEFQTKSLKILIAEDDETSDFLITSMLKKNSHEVLHVITGVDAVETCRKNPDIDLVLMDIRMPRLNGYDATRQIRQFNKEVLIIAQTAYGLSGDRQKAIDAGCNEYVSKPINKEELLRLMQKYFKK